MASKGVSTSEEAEGEWDKKVSVNLELDRDYYEFLEMYHELFYGEGTFEELLAHFIRSETEALLDHFRGLPEIGLCDLSDTSEEIRAAVQDELDIRLLATRWRMAQGTLNKEGD